MKKHKGTGMSYFTEEFVDKMDVTIDTGGSYLVATSGKGKSFFGEALELLDQEGSLLVSSIQRHLKVDFDTAKSIIDGLIEANLVKKSADNFSYIKS